MKGNLEAHSQCSVTLRSVASLQWSNVNPVQLSLHPTFEKSSFYINSLKTSTCLKPETSCKIVAFSSAVKRASLAGTQFISARLLRPANAVNWSGKNCNTRISSHSKVHRLAMSSSSIHFYLNVAFPVIA
jgi:hypothetical protein